jgi:hypothetical protein
MSAKVQAIDCRFRPSTAIRDRASKRTVRHDELFGESFSSCAENAIWVNLSLSGLSVAQNVKYKWNPRYASSRNQSSLSCVLAYWTGFGVLDSFVVYV